jgi:hypothetical protein
LGSYLLGVLSAEQQDYITFHLQTITCPCCLANLADLKAQQGGNAAAAQKRRRRYFDSSAGFLQSMQ